MRINSLESTIIVANDLQKEFSFALKSYKENKKYILVDTNTRQHCLPVIEKFEEIKGVDIIEIPAGEDNKSIDNVVKIWNHLSKNGADRKSLLINLGGGMLSDLGGFAASTFKRGIDFINIPTTLLSQVDASIGGKLGINFNHLKNEIGVFNVPQFVIIDTVFFNTLDDKNILSGYAEMIKHALIYSIEHWNKLKTIDIRNTKYETLKQSISKSLLIKNDFVLSDFKEGNIRKALNFGHTIGHAFESFMIENGTPLLHGEAVAHGIICELYLSLKKLGFPENLLNEIAEYILINYGKISIPENIYEQLYDLMKHDKKNENQKINFTLLSNIGEIEINEQCSKELVFNSFDFYTQLTKSEKS